MQQFFRSTSKLFRYSPDAPGKKRIPPACPQSLSGGIDISDLALQKTVDLGRRGLSITAGQPMIHAEYLEVQVAR